jgi:hypothetical protein
LRVGSIDFFFAGDFRFAARFGDDLRAGLFLELDFFAGDFRALDFFAADFLPEDFLAAFFEALFGAALRALFLRAEDFRALFFLALPRFLAAAMIRAPMEGFSTTFLATFAHKP